MTHSVAPCDSCVTDLSQIGTVCNAAFFYATPVYGFTGHLQHFWMNGTAVAVYFRKSMPGGTYDEAARKQQAGKAILRVFVGQNRPAPTPLH